MTTAIATRDTHALEPTTFEHAWRMAEVLFASRMFPESVKSPEQAMVILMKGRELGIPTMQALTEIYVVKGKVSLSANLMVGLVLRSGMAEYFEPTETSATKATYRTKRKNGSEQTLSYTIAEAQQAGLVRDGVWKAHPADMLRARAASKLARMIYPDILTGCYTPDEIGDIPDQPPQRVQATADPPQPVPSTAEPTRAAALGLKPPKEDPATRARAALAKCKTQDEAMTLAGQVRRARMPEDDKTAVLAEIETVAQTLPAQAAEPEGE